MPFTQLIDIESTIIEMLTVVENFILYKIIPSSDIVLSIFYEDWPSCAREWTTRERFWPDVCSVENIVYKVDFTLS